MKFSSTKQTNLTRLKFLIYGVSGVGKTTLVKTIKGKTLIISAESGLLPLRNVDIDVCDITQKENGEIITDPQDKVKRLLEVYNYLLTSNNDYEWIVIDSITEIGQVVREALSKMHEGKKDSFIIWADYLKQMRSVIKRFRDLPKYNVVMLALEELEKDEVGKKYSNVALDGKIALEAQAHFDFVFNMRVAQTEDKIERLLITQPSSSIVAKDRSGVLNKLEKPDLELIKNKILNQGEKNV